MSDPVAVLSGELDRAVRDEPAAADAPPRSIDNEEVPHDAGIEEQMAKRQGPWPSSNRTQVERDAQYTAASGAIDVNKETEDVAPVTPEDLEPAIPEGSIIADITEHINRIADDLDGVADLKKSLDRLSAAAGKVSGSETIKTAAARRVARILLKTGMEVRNPTAQRFLEDTDAKDHPSPSWDDKGWWYEKQFKVAEAQRDAFKVALQLEALATEHGNQMKAESVPGGVKVSVDRTPTGYNPAFTKEVDRIYEEKFLDGRKKVAGEIKALIIKKVMIPREDHVCPHCEQAIGEKESHWPEEYRDHPDLMVSQHGPCGGLYSQPRIKLDVDNMLKGLLARRGEDESGNPLHLNKDPGEWHDHSSEELCEGCQKPQDDCICGSVKMAAAELPYRRRVEVILTDGLNVWGEKKTPEQGGVWFPGGGVDTRDEKFADAAAREVVEESGFTIKEIYRLANVPPCTCSWDKSTIEESEKWAEKGKKWKGDRTYMYVATVEAAGAPTSEEGDAMDGDWMTFASAIRKLRNAIPHDNKGWQRLTRTRLRAIMQIAPAGLKVPRRGEVEDFVEEVTDEVASV